MEGSKWEGAYQSRIVEPQKKGEEAEEKKRKEEEVKEKEKEVDPIR